MQLCNYAQTVIDRSCKHPTKLAVCDGYCEITYGELAIRIKQIATHLVNLRIQSGDSVVITMEDCVDWPCIFYGCLYIGAVPVAISPIISTELFSELIDHVDAKLIFAGDTIAKKILKHQISLPIISRTELHYRCYTELERQQPVMVHPDSPGFMALSSGSTGRSKVAVHRHQSFYEVLKMVSPCYGLTEDSVFMSTPKMSWGFGLMNSVICALGTGATAIVISDMPVAKTVFTAIKKFTPTIVLSTPAIISRMVKLNVSDYTLPSSIKHFHSSSEDLPTPIYNQFVDKFGIRIYCSLGQLETWLSYAVQTDNNYQPGTVGTAISGTEIKIINEHGGICKTGQVGEVYAKSPTNAMYYYKDYLKSQYTFNGEWVRTGDCAYWNDQGNLVFAGRVDDVFKINDLTVIPTEIESKIMFDTTISQVAVTGIQNAIGVKEVHVFVVPTDNFNLETFNKFLDTQLFAHQRPRHIHIIDALPETVTNKKDRKTLSKVLNNAVVL